MPVCVPAAFCTTQDAEVRFHPVGTTSERFKAFVGANEMLLATMELVCEPVMLCEKLEVPFCDEGVELNVNVVAALSYVWVVFLIVSKPLFAVIAQSVGFDVGCSEAKLQTLINFALAALLKSLTFTLTFATVSAVMHLDEVGLTVVELQTLPVE